MFRLYHSNDLDVLKGILINILGHDPVAPFQRDAILVQSQGMAHWLKMQLADGLGVAAQIDFPLPSSFVWQIFNALNPELPSRSYFDKQPMTWRLLRLLPELITQPECVEIAEYLADDEQGLKAYQLAQTIADVFDQYLVYRPDWLLHWEQGHNDLATPQTPINTELSYSWQPFVWRALVADSEALGQSTQHRAHLLTQLDAQVRHNPERLSMLPKRIAVFGIAALPASYWSVLHAVAEVVDVHFFLLNPCRNYWGDIVDDRAFLQRLQQQPDAALLHLRGNPLLASWGKLGRDFLTLVHEQPIHDIDAYVDREPTTLLQHVQRDILELQDRMQCAYSAEALIHSRFKQVIATDDRSLRFVSAHSPLREVQRLHDQMVYWLNHDVELQPRDIVVMVPDIDQYAPYIDAVFSSASEYVPWAIADQSQSQENPLINSFLSLMGLAESRLSVTEVQDWLDVPAIRHRFGIAEHELPILNDWLRRAQIRWGVDGEQRQQLGLPHFAQNSWRQGLRQLLLGLFLPEGSAPWQEDWPISAVEGNATELLGKLMHCIDQLAHWQLRLQKPHAVADWPTLLQALLADFYTSETDDIVSLQRIRDAIAEWQLHVEQAALEAPLTLLVVRHWFVQQLAQAGGWQRFLAGPVNFCTLMPMRSIPFKAVCMLGMNDADYPRRVTPVGFDLLASTPARRGDRSRRDDDRYLFLEAICSAQAYLYLSYRGRTARDNAEQQPSVLISELLDYVGAGYCLAEDVDRNSRDSAALLRAHLQSNLALQPYHARAFSAAPGDVGSYHQTWARVAQVETSTDVSKAQVQPLPLPPIAEDGLLLWEDVKDAISRSARFFAKRRLRVSLDVYWQEQEEDEPFSVDRLQEFQLRDLWLQQSLTMAQGLPSPTFSAQQHALGKVPVGAMGDLLSHALVEQMQPLLLGLQPLLQQPDDLSSLRCAIQHPSHEPLVLLADLNPCYRVQSQHYQVRYRAGAIRGTHVLMAWLDVIVSCLSSSDTDALAGAVVLGIEKGHVQGFRISAPSADIAQDVLQQALAWYWHSWCEPLLLLPNALWSLQSLAHEDRAEALKDLINKDDFELNDLYVQRFATTSLTALHTEVGREAWLDQYMPFFEQMAHYCQPLDVEALAEFAQ